MALSPRLAIALQQPAMLQLLTCCPPTVRLDTLKLLELLTHGGVKIMAKFLSRAAPIAFIAVLVAGPGAAVAQAPNPVCQKTLRGVSICDVATDVAQKTSAQIRPNKDTSVPAAPGEAMRYTEIYSQDNQVILKGRLLFDKETFARNIATSGKSLDQMRADMDAAGRQGACGAQSRPFIDAGGVVRMSVGFPDGSQFFEAVYDRC